MEDMGTDPNRETAACGHPALESTDETQKPEAGDGYATRHDPFVYFHSVIDNQRSAEVPTVKRADASVRLPRVEVGLA